jgi:predicted nucleic acid-binding protein
LHDVLYTIWYAAADSSDRSNARSKAILKSGETLMTSDHVLVETWTLLHHKLDCKERFWEGLRSGIAVIETVTLADLEVAWDIAFPGVARLFLSWISPVSPQCGI